MENFLDNQNQGIVPPKESTRPKPKSRVANESDDLNQKTKINFFEKLKNTYSKWSYSYFFLICIISLFVVNRKNYLEEIFPILCYIGFIVLFINHLIWSKRLNFCRFKIFSTISLILYFIASIVSVIYNYETIYEIAKWFFIGMAFVLFLFMLKNNKKDE